MHLAYAYIGSGKNGNAVPWGRMKKEQDSRRNPDGFRQKVPVELKVCGTWQQENEIRKKLPKISTCIQQEKKQSLRKHRRKL